MNAQKESLKKTSGVHTSSHKPMKKCAMKMKQRKNDACVKMLLMVIGRLWKSSMINCKEPQVDDC